MLRKHGFESGKNLEPVERYSDGNIDRLPRLAHELAAINADVLVAITRESTRAIQGQRRQRFDCTLVWPSDIVNE